MYTKNRFRVFSTKTHSYLRILLAIIVALNFYISSQLDYLWLYCISFVLLIIVTITMSFLYSYVTLSSRGIRLRYGILKTYEIRWEEVQCCGTFSIKILGAEQKEEYIYFSKKPVSYSRLVASNTLPPQSNEFIFLAKQNSILPSINELWHDGKAKNLCTNFCVEHNPKYKWKQKFSILSTLSLSCLVCIIAYILSQDQRWVIAAVLSIFAISEAINVNQ